MVKRLLKSCFVFAFVSAAIWIGTANVSAATLTVDDPGTTADFDLGDGVCDTDDSVGDGPCTLPAAVAQSNFDIGSDTIEFSANYLISLTGTLTITDTLIIDGYTCPGYAINSGPDMGGAFDDGADFTIGCTISGVDEFTDLFDISGAGADGTIVRGLGLIDYRYGLNIDGADGVISNHNMYGQNDFETITGTQSIGVYVTGGAIGTTIGTPETGNTFVNLDGAAAIYLDDAIDTVIQGNTIGNPKDGETLLGLADRVSGFGIYINSVVDGVDILGNRIVLTSTGIESASATNIVVQGNDIGFGADNGNGEEDLGNITNGASFVLSGTDTLTIGTDGDGTDDDTEGNDIAGNGFRGVFLDATGSTVNTTVAGNNFGVTSGGTVLANGGDGLYLIGEFITIGSNEDLVSDTEEANVFEGNGDNGMRVNIGSDNIEINGNTFDTNTSRGARFDAGAVLEIKDNFVTGHTSFNGMEFYGGGGAGTVVVRNHFDGNRVGISTEGLDAALTIGGLSLTDANYFYNTVLHGVHMHGGTFSPVTVQYNYFGIEPNLVTLGPNGYNVSVRNESSAVYNNEMYATNTGAHIENFQDGIADPILNTFSENNFYGGGLAHDLGGNGVTADNGSYPEAPPTPNEGIDPPENMSLAGFVLSGDAEPGATIEIYHATDGSSGMASGGEYLVTTVAGGGGAWSYDLTGLVSVGDFVNAAQTESGNTSEFAAGLDIVATPGSGSGRRRIINVLETQDYTAPIGLPSTLLQGVNVENSSVIASLRYISLDEDPVTIFEVDPEQRENGIFFTTFLKSIGNFLTAMLIGEDQPVALVFEGQGSEDYFVPLEAGEYHFQVDANHPSGNSTNGTFIVTVEAPPAPAAEDCTQYDALNSYYQTLSSIETCSENLEDDLENIKMAAKNAIPAQCLKQITPPQLSCIEVEKCMEPDFERIKQLYLDTIKPANFNDLFPAEASETENFRTSVNTFESSIDEYFEMPHNIKRIEQSQCEYKYTYYDYPGEYQFGQYGLDENVVMIYQIENIFSGLITGKILGSYINLIRGHAVIATSRLYQDVNGVFWALFDEKDLDVDHVDVDPAFHPLRGIYSQYEQGYSLEEVIAIALDQPEFISIYDLNFLSNFIETLLDQGETKDDESRFLLPTSDIRRIDLIEMIESSIRLNTLFESDGSELDIPEEIDTPFVRDLVAPYHELGIMNNLTYLNHPIPRGEAFTIFYRLQQLNHFLRDELDMLGITIESDGRLMLQGEEISQREAIDITRRIITDVLNSNANVNLILKARTEPLTSEFWDMWNIFKAKTGFPYDKIKELLLENTNIDLPGAASALDGDFNPTLGR